MVAEVCSIYVMRDGASLVLLATIGLRPEAVGLARLGAKVGLLDGDIYGPSLTTMLGLDDLPASARGNTLMRNRGDGSFADTSRTAGVEMGRWAWGSRFVDFNNDGWEDLVVSNGFVTTSDTGDL